MKCPRCGGYTTTERDMDGTWTTCVACGWEYGYGRLTQEQALAEVTREARQRRPPRIEGIPGRARWDKRRRYQA